MNLDFTRIGDHTIYKSLIRENPVVVDLGANRGNFSSAFSKTFGGVMYLVEANPELASKLSRSYEHVLNAAVIDNSRDVEFNISHNDEGSSIYKLPDESVFNCTSLRTVSVKGLTFSAIVQQFLLSSKTIDLLKIDIEGAEVLVIPTISSETLANIAQISVEFHSDPRFVLNIAKETDDAIRYLKHNGFIKFDFTYGNKMDVLFVNKVYLRTMTTIGLFRLKLFGLNGKKLLRTIRGLKSLLNS